MSIADDIPGDFPPFSDDDTSREAAGSVAHLTGKWRTLVYKFIHNRHRYGATCDEMEVLLERSHQSVSARLWELHNQRFIKDSGERRLTRSGRRAVVWVIARDIFEEAA